MIQSYNRNQTQLELNIQLLIGLRKHLEIASDTSKPKKERLQSLENLKEVLEYLFVNCNEAIPEEERKIYERFFAKTLNKVSVAIVKIHTEPVTFADEIGFIKTLLNLLHN